jgi:hypothetical protein
MKIAQVTAVVTAVACAPGCGSSAASAPSPRDAGADQEGGSSLGTTFDAGADSPSLGPGSGLFTYTATIQVTPSTAGIDHSGSFTYTLTLTSQLTLSTQSPVPGVPTSPGEYFGSAVSQIDLSGGGTYHVTDVNLFRDVLETASASGQSLTPAPAGDFSEKVMSATGRSFEAPFLFTTSSGFYATAFLVTPFPLTLTWTDTTVETQDCDLPHEVVPDTDTYSYDSSTGIVHEEVMSHCGLPNSTGDQMVDTYPPYLSTPGVAAPALAGAYDGSGVIDGIASGQKTSCDDVLELVFQGTQVDWAGRRSITDGATTCSGTFEAHLHVELPSH